MLSNIFQFHLARNVSTHSGVIQLLIEQFHVNGTIIKPSASKLHCNLAFGTCCEIIIRCFKMLLQQNIHAIWIFINSRIKHGLLLVIWTIGHSPGKEKDTFDGWSQRANWRRLKTQIRLYAAWNKEILFFQDNEHNNISW